jgi:hypothetical protein
VIDVIPQLHPLAALDVAAVFVVTLIVIGVLLVSALVFGGWLIVSIVRLIGRAVGPSPRPNALPAPALNRVRCGRQGCGAENPTPARFCRRCGRILNLQQAAAPAPARRVAMW